MEKELDKLGTVIPEFFYELVTRAFPGIVVLSVCFYWSGGNFKDVFSTGGESGFVLAGFVLIMAWIVGITLDAGAYQIGKLLRFDKLLDSFPKDTKGDGLDYIRRVEAWERKLIFMQMALVIFFRSMGVICFFTFCVSILNFLFSVLNCSLLVFNRFQAKLPLLCGHFVIYGLVSFVFACVFGLCWHEQRKSVIELCKRFQGGKFMEDWQI